MTTRRDLCLSIPALAFLSEALSSAAGASIQTTDRSATEIPNGSNTLAHNQIFRGETLPMHQAQFGSTQAVVRGTIPTGEGIELHNTVLLPGHEPHPPHQHLHTEFLLIREGQVEWLLEGKRQTAGPGDICYAASNQLHGVRNAGDVTASYFVVAIGPNLRKT